MDKQKQEELIRLAQKEVDAAIKEGNNPFGAVITDDEGEVIASAHNTQNTDNDPTAHAEINLLRKVGKMLGKRDLTDYRIFGNAEPCSMCASAVIKAKIRHIYFGAYHESRMDPMLPINKVAEAAKSELHIVGGILEEECEKQVELGRKALN